MSNSDHSGNESISKHERVGISPPVRFRDMRRELSGQADEDLPDYPNLPEPAVTTVDKPVSELTVGLIVSLGAHAPGQRPLGRTNDLSYRKIDRSVPTSEIEFGHLSPARFWADQDLNVAFPRDRLAELESEGAIGALAPAAISILGAISRWDELATETAPGIKRELDAHGVDLALVVPFCAQCHQATMVLARALEARGMPTLNFSVFQDITEAYRPPRTAAVDYPVGSPCGRVNDPEHQRTTLRTAFRVPLDVGTRQVVSLGLDYQADGRHEWVGEVLAQYRANYDVVVENAARTGRSGQQLVGQEKDFAIRCNC